jgi:hypothetical protein
MRAITAVAKEHVAQVYTDVRPNTIALWRDARPTVLLGVFAVQLFLLPMSKADFATALRLHQAAIDATKSSQRELAAEYYSKEMK